MASLLPLLTFANRPNEAAVAGLMAFGCFIWIIVLLALVIFPIFCFWKIFTKAGHNGAMALLCLIPGIGMIIVLCILAFGEWPVLRNRQ